MNETMPRCSVVVYLVAALSLFTPYVVSFPFTSSCIDHSTYIEKNDEVRTCEAGTLCSCSRFVEGGSAVKGTWNCIEGEKPCRNVPFATPRYPQNAFQATVSGWFHDGASYVNITNYWIHDTANQRDRMDAMVWERSRSPNPFFTFLTSRLSGE